MELRIEQTWDGRPARSDECATLRLAREDHHLVVRVEAPFHADPRPPGPAGPTEGLWDYEVVELFVLARPAHYLEIELGPHGHHLVLELRGARHAVRRGLPLDFRAQCRDAHWSGVARVPLVWLPPGADRANAYALHGSSADRRHLAWRPVPGSAPDFHRLACFGALDLGALPAAASPLP